MLFIVSTLDRDRARAEVSAFSLALSRPLNIERKVMPTRESDPVPNFTRQPRTEKAKPREPVRRGKGIFKLRLDVLPSKLRYSVVQFDVNYASMYRGMVLRHT